MQILPLLKGTNEHLITGHSSIGRHREAVDPRRISRRVNVQLDELVNLANGLLRLRVLVFTDVLMAF